MKMTLIIVAVLVGTIARADDVAGTAKLRYIGSSEYQPGSCATQEPRRDGLECIDFIYWMRYRLEGLRDLKLRKLGRPIAVMATHLPRKGEWLVVLEKLSDDEAAKFKAEYRIIDAGPAFQAACLSRPIPKHLSSDVVEAYVDEQGERICYDVEQLHRDDR